MPGALNQRRMVQFYDFIYFRYLACLLATSLTLYVSFQVTITILPSVKTCATVLSRDWGHYLVPHCPVLVSSQWHDPLVHFCSIVAPAEVSCVSRAPPPPHCEPRARVIECCAVLYARDAWRSCWTKWCMYTDAAQLSARRKYPALSIETEDEVPIFPLLLFMHQHKYHHLTPPHKPLPTQRQQKLGLRGIKMQNDCVRRESNSRLVHGKHQGYYGLCQFEMTLIRRYVITYPLPHARPESWFSEI